MPDENNNPAVAPATPVMPEAAPVEAAPAMPEAAPVPEAPMAAPAEGAAPTA